MTEPLMKLNLYSGEPCGAGNFPSEVLEPSGDLGIPMRVALTTDRRTLLLMDSVDYYRTKNLDKAGAERLAQFFKELAEAMAE